MNRYMITLLAVVLAAFLSTAVSAQQEPPAGDEPPATEEQASPEEAGEPASRPEMPLAAIPLQRNLRFTVRPTILGLIPPDSADNYGEGLVRVSAHTGRRVELHYEIKEEIEKERGGDELFELNEAPIEMRTEFLTRIRRGDITVPDMQAGQRIASPLFWGDGDFSAEGYGLLWLSPGTLEELATQGSVPWDPQCAADPQSDMGRELATLIEARRRASGQPGEEQPRLELVQADGRYIVPVNGEMSQLEAVQARDSFGLAEYWFLNDPGNPLLLKMSFIASPDASPSPGGIERQLQTGVGFAITSINY